MGCERKVSRCLHYVTSIESQVPMDSSKPVAAQVILVKISGSYNYTERHGCAKGASKELVGAIGVGDR